MTTRSEVYAAIDSERDYQEMRVKRDSGAGFHTPEEFLLYIEHYVHLAREIASTTWGPEAKPKTMDAIRKVAALCVVAGEQHGMPRRDGF